MPAPPPKPRQNWARASKLWFPIAQLPAGGTPVVLANADQSIHWFCEKPNKLAVKHERHLRDDAGIFLFDEDEKGQQSPKVVTETISPEWWSPAVYVDAEGRPVP
jgi:hypothetical protein